MSMWQRCVALADEAQMVDFDAVRKIPDAGTRWGVVGMGDDDHTVAAVYQFLILSAIVRACGTPIALAKWHVQ